MRRRGGGGVAGDAAAQWRRQQHVAALEAAACALPGMQQLPVRLQAGMGRMFASLAAAAAAPAGGAGRGSWGQGAALAAAAQYLLQLQLQQQHPGQFTASLLHAYCCMAWDAMRCLTCAGVQGAAQLGSPAELRSGSAQQVVTGDCAPGPAAVELPDLQEASNSGGAGDGGSDSGSSGDGGNEDGSDGDSDSDVARRALSRPAWLDALPAACDPWGPAADWQLTGSQYAHLVRACGWEHLAVDMLMWLPVGAAGDESAGSQRSACQQWLLACLLREDASVALGIMCQLWWGSSSAGGSGAGGSSSPGGSGEGGGSDSSGGCGVHPPCAWPASSLWAIALLAVQAAAAGGDVELAADAALRRDCLLQLCSAAGWGCASPTDGGGGDVFVSTDALAVLGVAAGQLHGPVPEPAQGASRQGTTQRGLARVSLRSLGVAAMQLLEQLLCSWQAELVSPGDAAAAGSALPALHASLQQLQKLLQQQLGALMLQQRPPTEPATSQQSGTPEHAAWLLQRVTHLSVRITMTLMAWSSSAAAAPPGDLSSTTANVPTSGTSTSTSTSSREAAAVQQQWQAMAANPLQWSAPAEPTADQHRLDRPDWLGCLSLADSSTRGSQQPAASFLAAAAASAAAARPPASQAPLALACLQLGRLARPRLGPGQLSEHLAGLAAAWLTPGVPCWWHLPATATQGSEAGAGAEADAYGPCSLTAVLLDMMGHCIGLLQLAAAPGGLAAQLGQALPSSGPAASQPGQVPLPWQQLPLLLVHMLARAGSAGLARGQQAALLRAVHAQGAPQRRLAQRLGAWRSGQPGLLDCAARAVVGLLNRRTAQGAEGQLVVLSAQQQAELAAALATELMPHALLWPDLLLRRLLEAGLQHRGMLPLVLDLLTALRPMGTGPAVPAAPVGTAAPPPPPPARSPDAAAAPATAAVAPEVARKAAATQQLPDSRLMSQLAALLLGQGSSVATTNDSAAAVQLVVGLVAGDLVAAGAVMERLVTAPLAAAAAAAAGGGARQPLLPLAQLRTVLALAGRLLGMPGSVGGGGGAGGGSGGGGGRAIPAACRTLLAQVPPPAQQQALALLQATDWPALLLGLCHVSHQLHHQARLLGQPDYISHSQSSALAAALAQLLARREAAAADERARSWLGQRLGALPWAQRVVLLPVLACAEGDAEWAELLQPASLAGQAAARVHANGSASASADALQLQHAMDLLLDCCSFSAAGELHAAELAAAFASPAGDSGGSADGGGGTGLGELRRLAQALAAAARQLPGNAARRGLMLALGQVLPFASEPQAARVLLLVLPAVVPVLLPAGSLTAADPAIAITRASASALFTCMQLVCRAVYLFLLHGSWCHGFPAAAQAAAEQCFRHLATLTLHMLEAEQQLAAACLAEVCRLVAALHQACDCSALQALLLQLLSSMCRQAGAGSGQLPTSAQAPPKAGVAAGGDQGSVSACFPAEQALLAAGGRSPAEQELLAAGEQLELLPSSMQALLRGALLTMAGDEQVAEATLQELQQRL